MPHSIITGMDYGNTIAIVCNKTSTIDDVMNKLLLLRNLDEITSSTLESAPFKLKPNIPNVIILHCEDANDACLKCLNALKADAQLKEVPVIIIANCCSREFFISAYEAGASEIIGAQAGDYELLIRTIWALRRNEIERKGEVREKFLHKYGIVDEETGFYGSKYGEDFISSEVASSVKYGSNACLMLIGANKRKKLLSDTIQNSLRVRDSVGISKEGNFYIFLPKTKLNGANTVFERINANFRLEGGLRASVIEIGHTQFANLKGQLEEALGKTRNGLTQVAVTVSTVTKEAIVAPKVDKLKRLKEKKNLEDFRESIKQEVSLTGKPKAEQTEEERNSILFKQSFVKKIKIVIEPLFRKYGKFVKENFEHAVVDSVAFDDKCEFSISKGEVTMALIIRHGGFSKVEVDIVSQNKGEKRAKRTVMEITELDFEKLSKIIAMMINEFRKNV